MPKKWWEIVHVRPQVLSAVFILGAIAIIAMFQDMAEIAGVSGAGIIALAKDVITSDN
tara:strand:+ start:1918 stop:2091 length:174 start_codon:yes stop_codon:yes gene_type:complete